MDYGKSFRNKILFQKRSISYSVISIPEYFHLEVKNHYLEKPDCFE